MQGAQVESRREPRAVGVDQLVVEEHAAGDREGIDVVSSHAPIEVRLFIDPMASAER